MTPPSMYDTPHSGEVKQILGRDVTFFPIFLTGWHKNRFLALFSVFDHLNAVVDIAGAISGTYW
jgi:hypothetical protein